MKTSEAGRRAIEAREGCVLHAYQDSVGVWTIGYGDTENVFPGLQISQEEADARLSNRLERDFEPAINNNVKVPLTQNQFDALVSFAYNVGVGAFKSSTLLRLLNAGADIDTVAEQFDRWHIPPEITGRRNGEKAQFLTPDQEAA